MQASTTFYEKLNTLPTMDDIKYLIGSYLNHYKIINNKAVFNGVKDLKTFNKIYGYIKAHFYYVIINQNITSDGNLKYPSDIYDESDYYIKYNQKIHTMTRDYIINLIETSTTDNNNLKTIGFLMNNYIENDEPCKDVELIDAAAEKGNYNIIKYFINKGGDAYPLYDTDFSDCSIKYLKSLFNLINDGFVNMPNIAFIIDKELCNRI